VASKGIARSRSFKNRLRKRYKKFFQNTGRDPLYWIVVPLLITLILTGMGSVALGRNLADVQGGVWGFSALGTRVEFVLVQIPILIWVLCFSLVPVLTRSFSITLACWFGIPLALWLGHTGLNLVQAVNVRFDRDAGQAICADVIRARHLGCTTLLSKKGKSQYCANVATLQGWPSSDTTIDISGNYSDAARVCFSAHRGFLHLPWIDGIHPQARS
jgi:hypothetical protein